MIPTPVKQYEVCGLLLSPDVVDDEAYSRISFLSDDMANQRR
jgi:hypothetical protein